MSKFDPHQVDRLFLLIGENPLPNYLAAMQLLATSGTLYLVYTRRTEQQAKRLKAVLTNDHAPHITAIHNVFLNRPEDRPTEIYSEIHDAVEGNRGTLGLHYTGGTKVMAVHAYRAIRDIDPTAKFSYLDSQSLKIGIEKNDHLNFIAVEHNVSLATIFLLHGIVLAKGKYSTQPILADISHKIAQSVMSSPILHNNSQNHKNQFKALTKDSRDNVLISAGLAKKQIEGKPPEEKETTFVFKEKVYEQGTFPDSKTAKTWATGGFWLEDYVLQQIKEIASRCQINDAGIDFPVWVQEGHYTHGHEDTFQLDVVFMRHYQLFALSCTTSADLKLCKQKLLEASVRAKQIGGSEARVALVCGVQDSPKLEAEMHISTEDKNVKVFGCQNWPTLSTNIAHWIESLHS